MQTYALNQNEQLISIFQATKNTAYFCPSCKAPMRVKRGALRSPHFYHITRLCSSSSTSLAHIHIQKTLAKAFSDAIIEKKFPLINRIADVAVFSKRIIFEVQISPISKKEVKQRNRDYGKLGFNVVWILHDQTFNRINLSTAERYLLSRPHYYTNINQEGKGIIYDQFAYYQGRRLLFKGSPLPVDLSRFTRNLYAKPYRGRLGRQLGVRIRKWGLSFGGDLFQLPQKQQNNSDFSQIKDFFNFRMWYKKSSFDLWPYQFIRTQLTEITNKIQKLISFRRQG